MGHKQSIQNVAKTTVYGFKCRSDKSNFDKQFIKYYDENSVKDYASC